MSNSQKKRNVKAGGSTSQSSGRSNTTGPKVSGKKPANSKSRDKAIADARKATSGGNSQMTIWVVAGVLVVALIVAGIFAVTSSNDEKEKARAAVDLGAGSVSEGAITWGEESAPVTVEYYIDLLCPACRVYETRAAETIEKYVNDGTAKLVVHPVAILDQQSQPAGYSSRAASALMCAGDKEGGYLYMKQLYENQPPEGGPGLSDQELTTMAEEEGLGDDWKQCFESGEHTDTPAANTKSFEENGYAGTPTVLVNGKELSLGGPDELEQEIEAAK